MGSFKCQAASVTLGGYFVFCLFFWFVLLNWTVFYMSLLCKALPCLARSTIIAIFHLLHIEVLCNTCRIPRCWLPSWSSSMVYMSHGTAIFNKPEIVIPLVKLMLTAVRGRLEGVQGYDYWGIEALRSIVFFFLFSVSRVLFYLTYTCL